MNRQSWNFVLAAATLGISASAPAFADATDATWHFDVGAAASRQPDYPGSKASRIEAFPYVAGSNGQFFLGPLPESGSVVGGGAYLIHNEHWRVGVGLGAQLFNPRKASDLAADSGLGDVHRTLMASAFATYQTEWFDIRAATVSDVGGERQGSRVSLNMDGRYAVSDQLTLTAGPGASWANHSYASTFFGVGTAQAAATGLSVYDAKAGLNAVSLNAGLSYRATADWTVGARLSALRLQGDAARSPITTSRSQDNVLLFVGRRF